MTLQFRGNHSANPAGLMAWLATTKRAVKLRSNHKPSIVRDMNVAEHVRQPRGVPGHSNRLGLQAKAA
jgi:transcription-repair coupling factor (superfamily II helicase)